MKLAGPLTGDAGGAVLLAVADESEAKTIVAADPAVKSGIFVSPDAPLEVAAMGRVPGKKSPEKFH